MTSFRQIVKIKSRHGLFDVRAGGDEKLKYSILSNILYFFDACRDVIRLEKLSAFPRSLFWPACLSQLDSACHTPVSRLKLLIGWSQF